MTSKKFKLAVLAIDGGGIRGIVPAMILAEIEKKTGKRIYQLFDLIAGTSTGGILSLGLVKPDEKRPGEAKFSAKDLINLYKDRDKVEKIFKKRPFNFNKIATPNLPTMFNEWPLNNLLLFRLLGFLNSVKFPISLGELFLSKYTRIEKEKVIKELLGETSLDQALKEIIVTSYATDKRMPLLFTSNYAKENLKSDKYRKICSGCKMYDAAMATSAAPTFFRPYPLDFLDINRGNYLLIDGGVIANNPTSIAIIEATKTYELKNNNHSIPLDEILVVSLGTGTAIEFFDREIDNWGLVKWVKPLIDIVLSGQSEVIDYQLEHFLSKEQYYRFQLGYKNTRMEEQYPNSLSSKNKYFASGLMDDISPENINKLENATEKFLGEVDAELEKLCNTLLNNVQRD